MALTDDIKALVHAVDFEPIVHLLLESSASAVLEQTLAERWWDTTHIFHIAERGMTMSPYDFHLMTGLGFDSPIINLKGESSTELSIELLGWRHMIETVRYFDLGIEHRPLPQDMLEDYARMAGAFLLYILGAYLFTSGGQTVFLRWLALFCDFGEAWEANWGQACLVYLYSSLDTLSRGTLHQLVGPWKLLKVSSLFLFFYSFLQTCTSYLCKLMFIHMSSRFTKLHLILLQAVSMSLSYKRSYHCICILQIIILQVIPCLSCKLSSTFLQTVILQIVPSLFSVGP